MTREQISDSELALDRWWLWKRPVDLAQSVLGAVSTKGRIVVFRVLLGTLVNAKSQTEMLSSRKLVEST
jgi:hypothetical protein